MKQLSAYLIGSVPNVDVPVVQIRKEPADQIQGFTRNACEIRSLTDLPWLRGVQIDPLDTIRALKKLSFDLELRLKIK